MKLSHYLTTTSNSITWEEYEQRLDRLAEYLSQKEMQKELL